MKNFKNAKVLVLIMLMICFFMLSIFGLQTRWGDTITHHFKGYNTIKWGDDVDDTVQITLAYEKELDANNKRSVERTLKKRLDLAGIKDTFISFDVGSRLINVNLPASSYRPNFDFEAITKSLAATGEWKLTLSEKEDPFMAQLRKMFRYPKDNSKNETIADASNIKSASISYNFNNKVNKSAIMSSKDMPTMLFVLDKKTKDALAQRKKNFIANEEELKNLETEIKNLQEVVTKAKKEKENEEKKEEENKENEGENKEKENETEDEKKLKELKDHKKKLQDYNGKNVVLLLDNEEIYNGGIVESLDEHSNLEVLNTSLSASEALKTVNIVSSGKLPVSLKPISVKKLTPQFGKSFKANILIASGLIILLMIAFITIKYRFIGLLAAFNVLGHLCFVIACFTGFVSFLPGSCLNVSSMVGIIFSLVFGISLFLFLINKFLQKLYSNRNVELSVRTTFKENSKFVFKLTVLIAVISCVVMLIFSRNNYGETLGSAGFLGHNLLSFLNINYQSAIFSFSHAVFFGSIGVLIFQYLNTKFMLKYICNLKPFKNSKVYGGLIK